MTQNYPGGDQPYPTDPTNPPAYPPQPSYPQQPGQPAQPGYGQQPPSYPPQQGQPPSYPQQPGQPPSYPQQPGQPQYPQQPPTYPPQPGQYPPPAYNQAPPPPYPQPQQPKKSNRGWIIGCSIAALVVLLICGGIGVALVIGAQKASDAVKSTGQAAGASLQLTLFCTDIQLQDYGSSYQLFSKAEQGRLSQSDYATRQQALDSSDGEIATCTIDPNHPLPSVNGNTATAQLQLARGDNSNLVTGKVTLVYEDSQWKIDAADTSLNLF